jgi:hypothetical protein
MSESVSTRADEAVSLFEAADAANRATPARVGNVVQLNAETASDVVVAGDLHGHRANFEAILRTADLDAHPRRHLVMQEVCHGGPTYPSGGCMSHRMLEDVARLKVRYPERVHFILSNHELAELTDYPIMKARRMLNVMFRLGMQEAYGREADRVRRAAVAFIASCPAAARIGQSTFVSHSLPEGSDRNCFDAGALSKPIGMCDLSDGGPIFRMVWGRDFRASNAEAYAKAVNAKVLIHGHEPCPEGYRIPNNKQLIIDCCGDSAYVVILPTDHELTHAEVVKSLHRLDTSG